MFQNLAQVTYSYSSRSSTTTGSPLALFVIMLPLFILLFIVVAGLWKVFKKAGKPGWAAIVPIYGTWVLFEITGYPAWLSLFSVVPFLNIISTVVTIMAYFKLAKLFGKSDLFGVMTVLFSFVCIPILGFGKAQFMGSPAAASFDNPMSFDPTNVNGAHQAPQPGAMPPAPSPVYSAPAPQSMPPQPQDLTQQPPTAPTPPSPMV
jgi:hypothetical protein